MRCNQYKYFNWDHRNIYLQYIAKFPYFNSFLGLMADKFPLTSVVRGISISETLCIRQTYGTKKIMHKCYRIISTFIWEQKINCIYVLMEELLSYIVTFICIYCSFMGDSICKLGFIYEPIVVFFCFFVFLNLLFFLKIVKTTTSRKIWHLLKTKCQTSCWRTIWQVSLPLPSIQRNRIRVHREKQKTKMMNISD